MLMLQAMTYIEGHSRNPRPIQNYAAGILTPLKGPDMMLNWMLSNSIAGKWAPMHAEKQPKKESFDHQGTIKMSFF